MKIPKTLHYVWLGKNKMPPLMEGWQKKWSDLHPGWQIHTWTEHDDLPKHMLVSPRGQIVECRRPNYLASCPTYAKRSDVWRYEILEQLGGVYLDTDFEPVKPLDPILDGVLAFAGLVETRYGWSDSDPSGKIKLEVGCSIMGSTPHHPFLVELVRRIPLADPKAQLSLAFPFVTEVVGKYPDVKLFDPRVFYPVPWDRYALGGRRSLRRDPLPPETCAVHRWSSNWYDEGLRPRLTQP
jgi:mannosyltransferase OCH1-like enzyme